VLVVRPSWAWAQAGGDAPVPRDVVAQREAVLPSLPAEFQTLEHDWITFEFPASVRSRVEPLVRIADEFRARLSVDLGHPVLLARTRVRIARTPSQMSELAPTGFPPPAYATGVAYPALRVAILCLLNPGTWDASDLVELMRHELTHVALADATAEHPVARWFNEGLAIRESGELPWQRRLALMDASAAHRLLPLAELERTFPEDARGVALAYAESADFVQFLMREPDRARFGSLLERIRGDIPFERALDDAYGIDLRRLEYEWREDVSRRYSLLPLITGGGVLWTFVVALSVLAWASRRGRAKAKLAQWATEEELQRRAAGVREAEDVGTPVSAKAVPSDDATTSSPASQGVRVVEHEGRYYTIH
jgi:hypothetical protein